jgi:hypothetical protein
LACGAGHNIGCNCERPVADRADEQTEMGGEERGHGSSLVERDKIGGWICRWFWMELPSPQRSRLRLRPK